MNKSLKDEVVASAREFSESSDVEMEDTVDTALERYDLIVMGRKIGTYDGWDDFGDLHQGYQNFEPVEELSGAFLPCWAFNLNYVTGVYETVDDTGSNIVQSGDLLPMLMALPPYEFETLPEEAEAATEEVVEDHEVATTENGQVED